MATDEAPEAALAARERVLGLPTRRRRDCARGIRSLSLFDSIARGQAGPASDVDC